MRHMLFLHDVRFRCLIDRAVLLTFKYPFQTRLDKSFSRATEACWRKL